MSVLRITILLLVNLALYAFLVSRLLGWRLPGWGLATLRQRLLSGGMALALTAAILIGAITILTSGLVSEADSVRILRNALWVDAAVILLLVILWVLPRLPLTKLLSERVSRRVFVLVLALALASGVALLIFMLLNSGFGNTRLLRGFLWMDGILILLLLFLWGVPRVSWPAFGSQTKRQRALSVALALALSAAAVLGGIALIASGSVNAATSRLLLRIALFVDAGMFMMLLALWIFPRLPWPVYGQKQVRPQGEWRKALGGLAVAGMIVATIVSGFILAYGETGSLDQPEVVEPYGSKSSTLSVVAVADTVVPPTATNRLPKSTVTATVTNIPTIGITIIPTATPAPVSNRVPTNANSPTSTISLQPTSTPKLTSTLVLTATMNPTATEVISPTHCVPGFSGWAEYVVEYGDTLVGLANQVGKSREELLRVNCLTDDQLNVGQTILIPETETVIDGMVQAWQKEVPPVIEGDLSDWGVLENTADSVVYGADNWSGVSDLGANFSLGWDAANLYLAVLVQDDVYSQTQKDETIFRGDSVEFLLDVALQDDGQHEKLSDDDYQIGLSGGDLRDETVLPQAYMWFPVGQAGSLSGVQVAVRLSADGYVLEAAIPWGALEVQPVIGNEYGFALSVSDNDLSEVAVQQSMVSSSSGRLLTDPTTWGILRLEP
ncbi:MAG: LysM peptidoglycan-binding domain-containing protein [Anaerolineales bacterium]|nr:LysM peptidoglycan-binding domain-containing protein [Anaerolineales bacterium]